MNSSGSSDGTFTSAASKRSSVGDARQLGRVQEGPRVVEPYVHRPYDLRRVAVGALRRLVDRRVALASTSASLM